MLRLTFSSCNASNIAEVFMDLCEKPKKGKENLEDRIQFAKSLFNNKEK